MPLDIVAFAAPIKYLWAGPASLLGLGLAASAAVFGARFATHSGVLEVTLSPRTTSLRRLAGRSAFSAITFGHVVIAASIEDQCRLRSHERVHVAQYELWGPVFLLAYPAESVLQFVCGRRPYLDNRFETQARQAQRPSAQPSLMP